MPKEKVTELEDGFNEAKILKVVKDSDGNKALGPNGFNFNAIEKCWRLMKGEIVQFLTR